MTMKIKTYRNFYGPIGAGICPARLAMKRISCDSFAEGSIMPLCSLIKLVDARWFMNSQLRRRRRAKWQSRSMRAPPHLLQGRDVDG